MINYIYRLIAPGVITVKYDNIELSDNVIVRPQYMSICHADQRYYTGSRAAHILRKKLPLALIHECMGEVVYDAGKRFKTGSKVVLIPNVPSAGDESIYENYRSGSKFRSSSADGFMRELVDIPVDRLIACDGIDPRIASMCELLSVAFHAVDRLSRASQTEVGRIGIWGDGSVGYLVALALKHKFPQAKICVIGMQEMKLSLFSFADEVYLSHDLPRDFYVDHAVECAGGDGCYYAGNQIIDVIQPQGTVMLMGVSEKEVALNTRMVLEKGLTLVGCSRSGYNDFVQAAELMKDRAASQRIERIISQTVEVSGIDDIYSAFAADATNPFKTVMKWNV